jgi:hypothetical protein
MIRLQRLVLSQMKPHDEVFYPFWRRPMESRHSQVTYPILVFALFETSGLQPLHE